MTRSNAAHTSGHTNFATYHGSATTAARRRGRRFGISVEEGEADCTGGKSLRGGGNLRHYELQDKLCANPTVDRFGKEARKTVELSNRLGALELQFDLPSCPIKLQYLGRGQFVQDGREHDDELRGIEPLLIANPLVVPYGLAETTFITPIGWTLTESTREVRLPRGDGPTALGSR